MSGEAWLVFGLGNPGPEYAATRHNIGQMVVAELASRMGISLTRTKPRANVGTGRLPTGSVPGVPGPRVVLATSTGYMNNSGGPLRQVADFYGIDPDHIIAVHDDVDLPFDTIKAKVGGGEGGHNGLRSMTSALGTKDYVRIRAGVARPTGRQDTADYVAAVCEGRAHDPADLRLRRRRRRRDVHHRGPAARAGEVPRPR